MANVRTLRTLISAAALVVVSVPFSTAQSHTRRPDIVDTAVRAGKFKTLATALTKAGLVDTLKSKGPFTVFAPTDEAFAKLPKGKLAQLLQPEYREQLRAILLYHVVPGRVSAAGLLRRESLPTQSGQRIDVRFGKRLTIDKSRVVSTDIGARNGVIHVIDRVLLPETLRIPEVAQKAGTFKTLLTAVQEAGLTGVLFGRGPFTVLAPTDDAFRALPKGTVASLLKPENRARLTQILQYHVIKGRVFFADAVRRSSAKALGGQKLGFGFEEGTPMVNGARILSTDIDCANGVIHVIDTVLIPRDNRRRLVGIQYRKPTRTDRRQLRLGSGEGIRVTALVKGRGAAKAGIRKNDVIIAIDGKPATVENLRKAKAARAIGERLELTIARVVRVELTADEH